MKRVAALLLLAFIPQYTVIAEPPADADTVTLPRVQLEGLITRYAAAVARVKAAEDAAEICHATFSGLK